MKSKKKTEKKYGKLANKRTKEVPKTVLAGNLASATNSTGSLRDFVQVVSSPALVEWTRPLGIQPQPRLTTTGPMQKANRTGM